MPIEQDYLQRVFSFEEGVFPVLCAVDVAIPVEATARAPTPTGDLPLEKQRRGVTAWITTMQVFLLLAQAFCSGLTPSLA